jgi:hypothetical protein
VGALALAVLSGGCGGKTSAPRNTSSARTASAGSNTSTEVPPGSAPQFAFPYPKNLEGSVLTGIGTPHAEYIIGMKNPPPNSSPTKEISRLILLAQVRDLMKTRFSLKSRAGHTPRKGYKLTCLSRTRIGSVVVYLSAWAARDEQSDAAKAFSTLINPKRWEGGCVVS